MDLKQTIKSIFPYFSKKEKIELNDYSDEELLNFINVFNEVAEQRGIESFTTGSEIESPTEAGQGRSSVPNDFNLFSFNGQVIQTDFNHEVLKLIEQFSIGNRHLAYALENIVTLSHTTYSIDFDSSVNDAQKAKMIQHLKNVASTWYQFSDLDGLVNDFFTQLGTYGAISYEFVPKPDLSGIDKIFLVSPTEIYFQYNVEKDEYAPLQRPTNYSKSITGLGYVPLNTQTYNWSPLRRWKNQPYAVPPFISALEDLILENDMLKSFKIMMKRAGMLGFLSLILERPAKKPNETDTSYNKRLKQYLETNTKQANRAFSTGVFVALKDKAGNGAEIKTTANDIDMRGGKEGLEMVKSLIYAGLKQDPALHGESFTTTEAFAKVLLEKMMKQIDSNQKKVSSSGLEELFVHELVMAGFKFNNLTVTFAPPSILDEKLTEEVNAMKLNTSITMRDQGFISQDDAAQMNGLEKAYLKGPVNSSQQSNAIQDQYFINASQALFEYINENKTEFNYHIPKGCNDLNNLENSDFDNDFLTDTNNEYITKVDANYSRYSKKSNSNIKTSFRNLRPGASLAVVQAATRLAMLKDWNNLFVSKNRRYVNKYVSNMYKHFRKDDSIFELAMSKTSSFEDEDFVVPKGVFDTFDLRTIEYLENSDDFYLGKFITDEDTINRVNKWIAEKFEKGEVPLGKDATGFIEFGNDFEDTLNLEVWKIRRIIETTSSKARNYSAVSYISQAELAKFEIVEVGDKRTCSWCATLNGKTYETTVAINKIKKIQNSAPADIGEVSEFATNVPIKEFEKLSVAELQARGFVIPPFHPHCRGRIVAVI